MTTERDVALTHIVVGGNFVQPGLKVAEAHLPYLEAYLKHLTKAGHHVLYSLPDFDDDGLERKIEFSAAAGATYDHFTKVSGIELELVSKHVERVWLEAAWLAHEQKFEGKDEIDFPLRNIAVAKWERKWRKNLPFDIEFGAPTVRLLCEREAILTFSLENIVYYAGDKEKEYVPPGSRIARADPDILLARGRTVTGRSLSSWTLSTRCNPTVQSVSSRSTLRKVGTDIIVTDRCD